MGRNICFVLLVLGLALLASSCGRVSAPERPDGSFYPHDYVVTQNP